MPLEIKDFNFELKEIDDKSGEFSGYASTFGNVDQGNDIVVQGAFKKSLKQTKGKIPVLADHDHRNQIGWNVKAEEDDKGLLVHGFLDLNVEKARERHSLSKKALEFDIPYGLSIGYRVTKKSFDGDIRKLEEVQLGEYSFVAFPMNTDAQVTDIKMEGLLGGIGNPMDFIEKLRGLLEFKPDPEETENEIRIRVKSPGLFQEGSFRQTTLKSSKPRVKAIVGRLKGETTTTVQSLRFPKEDGWTKTESTKWAKEHDFIKMVSDLEGKDETPCIHIPEIIATDSRDFEKSLRDVGFSQSKAKAIVSGMFSSSGQRDVDAKSVLDNIKEVTEKINPN